jgi:opacity protein-like surface antigen
MSVRKLAMVLAAVCAAALLAPVAAGAQTPTTPIPTTSFTHVPVSGTAHNGKQFTGHFNVSQFVTRGGKTYALGTLTGKLGNRTIKRSNVAIPASVPSNPTGIASSAAACPILHLVLGPLNLNLLGLTVHLNQVVLDITAQSGSGNLLGNLLCSVSNLLNGTGGSTLSTQQLTGLLNIVQQLLNVPGLQGLL